MQSSDDEHWMTAALALAREAGRRDEVPVGAIVIHPGPEGSRVIGSGFNLREHTADPTAHAEIIALREAARWLGHWRLNDCTLYVTLEPCPMCAGALVNARLGRLVYGCTDPKAGAVETLFEIPTDTRLNHRVKVLGGVLADPCAEVLRTFFRARRRARPK
ncbi:MAG: tRNA adenosine(34) deaminase TadA [Planctomycetota bacterium]